MLGNQFVVHKSQRYNEQDADPAYLQDGSRKAPILPGAEILAFSKIGVAILLLIIVLNAMVSTMIMLVAAENPPMNVNKPSIS